MYNEDCEFGHDEIDECDNCGGCRECGDCHCKEYFGDDADEDDGLQCEVWTCDKCMTCNPEFCKCELKAEEVEKLRDKP
jgi:hypothetical protein